MIDDDDSARFLPLSSQEYERRKESTLSGDGVVFDIDQQTGEAKLSLSEEAHAKVSKRAAEAGMDVETYIRKAWDEQVSRQMAKKRRNDMG